MTTFTVVIDDRCTGLRGGASRPAPPPLDPPLKRPLVDDRRCTACGACVEVCPRGAIWERIS